MSNSLKVDNKRILGLNMRIRELNASAAKYYFHARKPADHVADFCGPAKTQNDLALGDIHPSARGEQGFRPMSGKPYPSWPAEHHGWEALLTVG
jgi:hypothetical protein